MTDPADSLPSFQQALDDGEIELVRARIEPDLFAYLDHPNGEIRITYVVLEERIVTAMAIIVLAEPYGGERCYGIGWAVPERYRRQGRASRVVNGAIAEFANGLAGSGVSSFYLEAVVGADNTASQRVAERRISTEPKSTTDDASGAPAFAYVRKFAQTGAVAPGRRTASDA